MTLKHLARMTLLILPLVLSIQTYAEDSLEGEWWVTIKGKTQGAAKLVFSALESGTFRVIGYGTTLSLGEFFRVPVSPEQTLQRASNGRISGTVAIVDENGDSLGTFEFDKGRVNRAFTVLHLKGNLLHNGATPVKFVGRRFLSESPVRSGLTQAGKVGGRGLKSKFYELLVIENDELDEPFQGFPFFIYEGSGPVLIDGVENEGVDVAGRLVIDANFRAYGTFFSEVFGVGPVSGKLGEDETTNLPRPKLKAQANRTVKVRGSLEHAVSPRISVDPQSTLDFDSVETDSSKTLSFLVTNSGDGTLSGTASLTDVNAGFTIASGRSYNLAKGASQVVEITFTPASIGSATTDATFTGGGGATRGVTGVGVGPMETLTVEPAATVAFGDVAIGNAGFRSFTVTNIGSAPVVGQATIAGAGVFRLVNVLDVAVEVLPYTLEANESQTVRVRFAPNLVGDFNASVSFTGGATVTRGVTGSGVVQ